MTAFRRRSVYFVPLYDINAAIRYGENNNIIIFFHQKMAVDEKHIFQKILPIHSRLQYNIIYK